MAGDFDESEPTRGEREADALDASTVAIEEAYRRGRLDAIAEAIDEVILQQVHARFYGPADSDFCVTIDQEPTLAALRALADSEAPNV